MDMWQGVSEQLFSPTHMLKQARNPRTSQARAIVLALFQL
tara:strand:+ start:834 stop:953 length:120 start_codon:yes stop_codon:yes gene_type:complete